MKKLLIAVLLVAFAAPAFAFQIALPGEGNSLNLYGQVRMFGWYQGVNDAQGSQNTLTESFAYGIQGNSRVGFDLNAGKFFGKVETSFNGDGENTGANGFGFRLLYGGYKFDHGGTLTMGRMFILGETSLAFDSLFDTDGGMAGYGTILSYRRSAIKYGIAGFEIGVFQTSSYTTNYTTNSTVNVVIEGVGTTTETVSSDMKIQDAYPEVQVAYNASFGPLTGKLFVTWAAFEMQNVMTAMGGVIDTQKEAINSVTAGLVLKPKFGPVGISFSAIYAYNGQIMNRVKNGGSNISYWASFDDIKVDAGGNSSTADKWTGLYATHTYGLAIEATYNITDMFAARVGGGWQSTSSEGLQFMGNVDGKKVKSLDSFSVYVNAPIKLNQYFIILPTVAYYAESKSNGEFRGKGNLLAGAQFRAIF